MSESPIREAGGVLDVAVFAAVQDHDCRDPNGASAATDDVMALLADPALAPHLLAHMGYEQVGLLIDGDEFIPQDLVPESFAVPPGVDVVAVFARVPRTGSEQE